jgi:hypothetical protein
MTTECLRALEIFRDRDFAAWRGLPADCDWETVQAVMPPVVDAEAAGWLGASLPRRIRLVRAEGYPRHVRVWFDGPRVVALESELPQLHRPLAGTIAGWGAPDARLDFAFDVVTMEKAELVYAARGFAAAVNPDNQVTLRIVVFPPTTPERYLAEFRPGSGTREHPE